MKMNQLCRKWLLKNSPQCFNYTAKTKRKCFHNIFKLKRKKIPIKFFRIKKKSLQQKKYLLNGVLFNK